MNRSVLVLTCAALLPFAASAANIIPSNWTFLNSAGTYGTLRAGSVWAPAPGLASQSSAVNNAFVAEGAQWNIGTWWWDEDASVNPNPSTPLGMLIQLNASFTVDRFVVQADNNDTYQLDYWDGSAWQSAFSVGTDAGAGMRTRDSGVGAAITTDRFRFYATGGDNYYSVSEIQAFSVDNRVPEPGALGLAALALAAAGLASRRARKA